MKSFKKGDRVIVYSYPLFSAGTITSVKKLPFTIKDFSMYDIKLDNGRHVNFTDSYLRPLSEDGVGAILEEMNADRKYIKSLMEEAREFYERKTNSREV